MKVALTVWENRVSPVFDSARVFLVAQIENGKEIDRYYERIDSETILYLVSILKQENISVLICGAISEMPARMLEAEGIKTIPFIAGNVDDVLSTLAKGVSITPEFLMPGCNPEHNRKRNRKNNSFIHKKEVGIMPRGDGTGPQGTGKRNGQGQGVCRGNQQNQGTGGGFGQGRGQGQGRGKGQGQGRGQGQGQGQGITKNTGK